MQLKDYIQGNRRGKGANRLEREAMKDPFLQGALDGLDSVAGDHINIIQQLEEKYSKPVISSRYKKRLFMYWAAAASVLLLIGFGIYFFPDFSRQNMFNLAYYSEKANQFNASDLESEFEKMIAINKEKREALEDSLDINPVRYEYFNRLPAEEAKKLDTYSLFEQTEKISLLSENPVDEQESQIIQTKVANEARERQTTDVSSDVLSAAPAQDSNFFREAAAGNNAQRTSAATGALSSSVDSDKVQSPFGEKEFQTWFKQKASKNICGSKSASVKASFFINENGKPAYMEFQQYSCEDAKKEVEKLLSASPAWTKTNRKVTLTVKW